MWIEKNVLLLPGLGSRSRSEPGVILDSLEPEPAVKKKPGTGAAPKKNQEPGPEPPLLYRLLEDKKHKEIVHL